MLVSKCFAVALLASCSVSLCAADADAEPQDYAGRRRLVVRKRKRPVGLAPNVQSFQPYGLPDFRDGRSLLSGSSSPFTSFGQRTSVSSGLRPQGQGQFSFQTRLEPQALQVRSRVHQKSRPVEPKVPRFSSFPTGSRSKFKARQQIQDRRLLSPSTVAHDSRRQSIVAASVAASGIHGARAAAAPQVPGLAQHQAALRRHQQQIQAQLALAKSGGRNRINHIVKTPPIKLNPIRERRPPPPRALPKPIPAPRRPPPPPPPPRPLPKPAPRRPPPPLIRTPHPKPLPLPVPKPLSPPPLPLPATAVEHRVSHVSHEVAPPPLRPPPPIPAAPALHAVHHEVLEPSAVRQGAAPAPGILDIGVVAAAGERCVDKIVVVEETEVDEKIECHHSYSQKCHTTYTTDFEPQQEEECEENFKKNCFIEYKKVAHNETVEFCHTPLVKDCNVPGPVECRTEYESMCETRYHNHEVVEDIPECITIKEYKCETKVVGYTEEEDCKEWPVERCNVRTELVNKATPETSCKKIPKEKCAPAGCGFVQGVPECFDKTETVIQEVPEEKCELEPQRHCRHVTTLVPNLKPNEECVDVPKEVCARSNSNPRKVSKPVVKKWCYTPTPESGLFRR